MRRARALELLGLTEETAASGLVAAYGERLSHLQQQLVSARSDEEQEEAQAAIAELIDAFELLGSARRRTTSPVNSGGTLLRTPPGSTRDAAATDIQTGDVLDDRYEVGRMLGRGGMGAVYEAFDRLKQEPIAIKVLVQELVYSAEAKERLLAEAKVTCNLSHPNIVRVYDVGVSGSHHFITMELLKGETLRQQMEARQRDHRPYSAAEITSLVQPLVDALTYAHRFLVHRDIKPENIWLCPDGSVKLMDFGIARVFSASTLTRTGMSLGTAYYMAPEQLTGSRDIDWRADQYAIAVMLYELLTGTIPVGAVKPLGEVRRDLPRSCGEAIMRALAPRREDRFDSLQDFAAALEQRSWRDSKGRVIAVSASAVCALVAAAGLGMFLLQEPAVDAVAADPGVGTVVTNAPTPKTPPAVTSTPDATPVAAPELTTQTVATQQAPSAERAVEAQPPVEVAPVRTRPAVQRETIREQIQAEPPRSRHCEERCEAQKDSCLDRASDERRACKRDSAFRLDAGGESYGMRKSSGSCEGTWRESADRCDEEARSCALECGH